MAAAPRSGRVPATRRNAALAALVVVLPLITLASVALRSWLALGTLLLLYLLVVVVISAVGGLVPGLAAAVLSFCLANWFLTSPYHSLRVDDRDSVIELAVFVVVAAIVSGLVELGAREQGRYRARLAEEQAATRVLEDSDRFRAALLASIGHDLRTPLATAKAAISTLQQDDVDWTPEQRDELLATADDAVDRLTHIITGLLDLSRLQAGGVVAHTGQVAVEEVVTRAVADRPVAVEIPDGVPPVRADAALVERVLDNLLANAIRFGGTGEVRVAAEHVPGTPPGAGDRVRVHVIDHGPGVPREDWDRMFVPLQRLDDRGSSESVGLGLAIAKGLAEAMDATLTPSRTPGGGLTMTLELGVGS